MPPLWYRVRWRQLLVGSLLGHEMRAEFRLPKGFEQEVCTAIAGHLRGLLFPVDYMPSAADLRTVLQVAFWSSLIRDEGRTANFVVNLRPRGGATCAMPFQQPIELTAVNLAKIAMATIPHVSAVRVGPHPGALSILGIDTLLSAVAPVRVAVLGPAMLAVKSAGATVARVSGGSAELTDLGMYGRHLFSDSEFPGSDEDRHRESRFLDIARAMQAHGHGGIVLILGVDEPPRSQLATDLELHFSLSRPFGGAREVDEERAKALERVTNAMTAGEVADLLLHLQTTQISREQYIAGLAQTTAIDGATLVSSDASLLAFGCKIRLSNAPRITLMRPTSRSPSAFDLGAFGGTRHQSAARFVGKYPGSRAIVSSQDGNLSILSHRGPDEVDCLEHAEWIL